MNKKVFYTIISLFLVATMSSPFYAQTTVTLEALQDARIAIKPSDPVVANTTAGDFEGFHAYAWTTSGADVQYRGLIEFDLSGIPAGAVITNAYISLFHAPNSLQGVHESLSGSNESIFQRVTSPWEEYMVTWNNQPSTTSANQVTVQQSTSPTQDYPNIGVTPMVQDMIDDPANSHGFMLRLVTEVKYRRLIFASRDHPDATLHPKLTVTYTINTSVSDYKEKGSSVLIHPNPVSNVATIQVDLPNEQQLLNIAVINSIGQTVRQFESSEKVLHLHKNELAPGIYFLRIRSKEAIISTQKIVIQ